MLKVWIWKRRVGDSTCRVSPEEPNRTDTDERYGRSVKYWADQDIIVCSKYIKKITGRTPTLKPRAFWFDGSARADLTYV